MMEKEKKKANFSIIFDLFKLVGSSRKIFWGSLVALAFSIGAESAGNLIIRHTVDRVILVKGGIKLITLWACIFLGVALLRGVLNFLHAKGKAKTSERVAQGLRDRVYDHLQRLSFSYHDQNKTGELIQRSTSDVDSVRRFYSDQIPELANTLFLFLINTTLLLLLNVKLALFSILIVPFVGGLSYYFFGKIFSAYDKYQKQEGAMTACLQENLSGIRVVRAFAQQEWEMKKFGGFNREQKRLGFKLNYWDSLYWPFGHFLCGLQFTAILFLGGLMTMDGKMTPGTYIAFTAMANNLIWPMQELGRILKEISKSNVSFSRISEILKEDQEDLLTSTIESCQIQGRIVFNKVSFHYLPGVPVLDDVSFSCEPGSKIALLGATGSGKTSLVNLLPRFYDYTGGEILLDGKPLKEYSRHCLRQNMGIVEQEPFLFSLSIRDNITYSLKRKVSQEEVERVAKAAAIHQSILSFPDGYDTMVGEKGVSLSGGQKQRVTIARTLLKDPRILILDDSTSAIDADTEDKIKAALENLMENRTTFIIAHRVQTLRKADKIFVLHQGRIVQGGTHGQLIAQEGFYKEVFDLQTQVERELQEELDHARETL